ncbi:MAG: PAS domain S-box protein [Pirellulales bacterium]|nr:PAS domain S-box protein [Pirellulales bacterium]
MLEQNNLASSSILDQPAEACFPLPVNLHQQQFETLLIGNNRILELILQGAELSQILQEIAKFMENLDPRCRSTILLLDEDSQILRHAVGPSLPEAYRNAIEGIHIGPDVGSCGSAAFRRQMVISRDIRHDPLWAKYLDLAAAFDLRACWSIPIMASQGQVLGTFAIYFKTPLTPTDYDLRNIRGAAHLAALAIEHHRSRTTLEKNERYYRLLVEHSCDAVCLLDHQLRSIYSSPNGAPLLGYPPYFMIGKSVLEIVHPEEHEYVSAVAKDLDGAADTVRLIRVRVRNASGEYRWLEASIRKAPPTIAPDAFVVNWRDITEKKLFEEKLMRGEQRYALATKAGKAGILELDLAGQRAYVDPNIWQILDLEDPGEISLNEWLQAIHPEDQLQVAALLDRIQRRQSDQFELELRLLNRQGGTEWFYFNGSVSQTAGAGLQIIGTGTQITQRYQYESQLRLQREELTHAARLSTLGELVASISHEINQPLYAIANFANALNASLNHPPDTKAACAEQHSKLRHWARQIASQAERAGEILTRLRNFARKKTQELKPLDPRKVILDAVKLMLPEARSRSVEISVFAPVKLSRIMGDAILIQQILANLLQNAIEAESARTSLTDEQGINVTVSEQDGHVRIEVRDHGAGITAEQLSQIFQPFYSTKPNGLGLGLAISLTIAQSLGGKLWAEPCPDKGAAFFLALPVCEE